MKNVIIFHQKFIVFTAMKYCSLLHMLVCLMSFSLTDAPDYVVARSGSLADLTRGK